MSLRQLGKATPKSTLFLVLCLFLLAACGSNTGASSGASATATACTRTAQPAATLQATIGTLKSINNKTLVLADSQGKSTTVTYSSATTFTREARIAASALKEGTSVSIVVMSTGSTYTAVSVMADAGMGTFTSNGSGSGGPPPTNGTPVMVNGGPGGPPPNGAPISGSSNSCAPKPAAKNASPGANNTNAHALTGTVSQVNGTTLTITDHTGTPYTVTLTAQTQIIGTQNGSASALKVGELLSVVGKLGSQNTVAANTIKILLSLPDGPSSPSV